MKETMDFRREMNRNYLVLRPGEETGDRYTIRMLEGNQVGGLLNFQKKVLDGEIFYYYDITSRQPLRRILEYRNINETELRRLISDLLFSLHQIESFLLNEEFLCLDPDCIYVIPESFRSTFCLIPGRQGDFAEEFGNLAQFLLDHVSHRDGEAALLAFGIFQESRKENFGIEEIENCLLARKPEKEPEEETKQKPKKKEKENLPVYMKPMEPPFREKGQKRGTFAAFAAIPLFLALFLPASLYLLRGAEGLFRFRLPLGAAEILCFLFFVFLLKNGEGREAKEKEKENPKEEDWEVLIRELPECPVIEHEKAKEEEGGEEGEEEEMQTVLLSAGTVSGGPRRLRPVDGGEETEILYFPFLIGKSAGLNDFCLNLPEVSRLHVRLDETDQGYTVTDLNSTNGTFLNGRRLKTNETCSLLPGSELSIASRHFLFL